MDELRKAIALLFRRKGRVELSEKEFVLSASMDLRWFPPREAQRLLQSGLEAKLLASEAGVIRPTFDVAAVDVPRDFMPGLSVLDAVPGGGDLFVRIVDAIASRIGSDRRSVISSVNAVQERMDVELEVAALIAAHRAGVDVGPFLQEVERRLVPP
ncbi:MAG: DUF2240 family protein [Methanobacteriota archaeon]